MNMERLSNFLFALWMILAIVAFVCGFFVNPLLPKIISLVFGGLNMVIILSWITGTIQARKELNNKNKELEV